MTATATERPALWPHQTEAVNFALQRDGAMLAIGMGGGKTRCSIEIADLTAARRVLVICPKSVVGVWPRELEQHSIRTWHVWGGEVRGARGVLANPTVPQRATAMLQADVAALKIGRPFCAVTNIEAAWRGDMGMATLGIPWDLVILDESHRLKSPTGKASAHAARVCDRVRARGGRVLALTGTPTPHTPLDLWAQLRALDGGQRLSTSVVRFRQRFGKPETIRVGGGQQRTIYKDVLPEKVDELAALAGQVIYRVDQDKLDGLLGLPETADTFRFCHLDPETRKVYDRLEKDLVADLSDGNVVVAANSMVLVTRLAQMSGGFAKDPAGNLVHVSTPPEKARLLADVLEDLAPGEPVVVFCRFHADLDAVQAVAHDLGLRYGELSGRRRDGLTSDSRMNPDVDLLGCQIKAGGVGIDLTRARYAVFYSLAFELADYLQARKRVHRPGQRQRTTYIHLLAENTIDRAVYGALRRRENAVNAVLDRLSNPEDTQP